MKIVICYLKDNVSEHSSIGAGRTQPEALEDAITHFIDKSPEIIRRRIEARVAVPNFHERHISAPAGVGRRR